MLKKLISLCLVLSLLITGVVPALATEPVETEEYEDYFLSHSNEELIQWINYTERGTFDNWKDWYPFIRAARDLNEILTVESTSEEYSLSEIHVTSIRHTTQYFFEKGTEKFMVYIGMPGTQDDPNPSLTERMDEVNRELALEYENLQYTAASVTLDGVQTPVYYCDGGTYLKKGSDETVEWAPTAQFDWMGRPVIISGVGDLYGSKWNHAYFNLFKFEITSLTPAGVERVDITEQFEEESFRSFVYDAILKTPGTPIYDTDVSHIQRLEVRNSRNLPPVESLAGIEYFTKLECLDISMCQITKLDLTMLKNLRVLFVSSSINLKSIDLRGLEKFESLLSINNSGLTDLKISSPTLISIFCPDSQLSELDLSGCPALKELIIDNNNLQTLDITPCPELRWLSCERNDFKDTSAIIGYDKNKWVEPLYTFDFYPQKPQPYATADISWYHEEEASFAIGTAEELIGLAQLVNSGTDFSGKTILLENNIDLSDYAGDWNDGKGWTPIGNNDAPFRGTFNGNNKTISGLYINDKKLDYAGLFGSIDQGKVIQLGLVNVEIHAKDHVGGIAGSLGTSNWTPEDYPPANCAAVKNCFVTGVVEGKECVGGIAGSISCSYINDCYAGADVTGTSDVGGVIGSAGSAGVENCYSTGSISGGKNVGGIAGSFSGGSLYTCYATGQIRGSDCVGGIVGNNIFFNITRQCAALNDSVRGETNVGRIAGYNEEDSQLETNYALGSMAIFEGSTQKATLLNTHDQVDGADIGKETAMTAAFWLETMEYRPKVFTIADGSYPALSKVLEIGSGFYRVSFVDWDGSELKSILVPHGSAAKAPASPVRKDYFFAGWDQALDNVTGDLTVTATYRLADPFADVDKNDWFYNGVLYAYEKDLMKGISEDRFAPQDEVSRAMAITVLYREMGSPAIDPLWLTAWPFQDVPMGEWYSRAALWGAKYGVVNGYDHRTFGPNDSVTREQLVTMFWRTRGCPEASADVLSGFSDAAEISSWAVDAFAWAVDRGLIQGKPGNTLDPQGTTTRAELAQILLNCKAE